jgi:hypothetical protein
VTINSGSLSVLGPFERLGRFSWDHAMIAFPLREHEVDTVNRHGTQDPNQGIDVHVHNTSLKRVRNKPS